MAEKKIYFGSQGPYLYDDGDDLDDGDGDFAGIKMAPIVTDGTIRQEGAPSHDNDAVRLQDISVGAGVTSDDFRYAFMLSSS